MKRTLSFLLIAVLLLSCLCGCAKQEAGNLHCTVSIDASRVALSSTMAAHDAMEKLDSKLPALNKVDVAFSEGETALDVVVRALQENKIQYEIDDTNFFMGIGNLYNGDAGELSGWLYTVNDESLSSAASQYKVQEGDHVCFFFVTDFMTFAPENFG